MNSNSSGTRPTRPRALLEMLLVAAAYFGGGALSLFGGLITRGPSGQSSVVWLPPGIALAVLLVRGKNRWPGLWLGAWALDLVMGHFEAPNTRLLPSLFTATVISGSSVVQALVTEALVRRYAGEKPVLDRPRIVLAFLLCGAAASLITSTVGSLSVILTGMRKLRDLPFDLPSWWVSDTVSVFLVTPVILAWFAEPARVWRPRRLQLTVPLFIALAFMSAAFVQANRLENDRARKDFELLSDTFANSIENELERASEATLTMADVVGNSRETDTVEFRGLVSGLRRRSEPLSGVTWVPYVEGMNRAHYEAEASAATASSYEIRELGANGELTRAGQRSSYFPIQFAETDPDVPPIVGLDLATLPGRRELLERARSSGELVMSGPLDIFGFTQMKRGVVLAARVGATPRGEPGPDHGGLVVCAVRVALLMRTVSTPAATADLDVRVEDVTAGTQLLFQNGAEHAPPDRVPYHFRREFQNAGRTWRLTMLPTPHYLHGQRSWVAPAVSGIGLAVSALLCGFVLVTTGGAASIRRQVALRTRELSHTNDKLIQEIETHRRTENALKESEARWQFALEEAGEGVWDWDVQGQRLYWSPRMMAVLGYRVGEIQSSPEIWRDSVHPDDLARVERELERHLRGETPMYAVELRLRRKDGEFVWLQTRAKVVSRDAEGRPLRMIGTQTEIGERKRTQLELEAHREHLEVLVQDRTEELLVAKSGAEEANRAKSLFLANMSHELRTPMHAILAYAHLGLDDDPPATLREFLTRIVDSAQRLLLLLNDLLDLSKLEAGKMLIERTACDLEQLTVETVAEMDPLLAQKQLSVRITKKGHCSRATAYVDRGRMTQVFRNIIANAVRFSRESTSIDVEFSYSELPSRLSSAPRPALQVTISDRGVGIPETELERIFDSFVQSSTTRSNAGGSGLGLAICRQIVGLHGGLIRAENNQAGGATLIVILPLGSSERNSKAA